MIRHDGIKPVLEHFAAPSWQIGLLVGLALDLVYRIASAVDAFRVARGLTGRSRSAVTSASGAGLIAVVLVMVLSHVAVGQTVYGVYRAARTITGGDSARSTRTQPWPRTSPAPCPARSRRPRPWSPGDARPTDTPEPTPTQGDWNGTDQVNILLIGADAGRANDNTYLTDTMIVMSIDPPTGRVAMISMPRDTVGVPLPKGIPAYNAYGGAYGCGTCKINTLYTIARLRPDLFPGSNSQRGYQALMGALGAAYGMNIQYYVAVDLAGFPPSSTRSAA